MTKKEWTYSVAEKTYYQPFLKLLYQAQSVHRQHFDPNTLQVSTLLNIKTGRCPEDCAYCPQSAHYNTGLKKEPLMKLDDIIAAAKNAKASGATRFCMGAAWRSPRDPELDAVCQAIKEIKALGLESCVTLGLLKEEHAKQLKEAGLDFYNHNIDTSENYYEKIITTRTFQDRLKTLQFVRESGLKVCCGGILGLGERVQDRIEMLITLANLPEAPESVPINQLLKIPGTPLEKAEDLDPFDFVRTVALARIMMPTSYVRLSAGRENMSDELQCLCFFAGVNSIFYGEKLLVTPNPLPEKDDQLFLRLGLQKMCLSVMS